MIVGPRIAISVEVVAYIGLILLALALRTAELGTVPLGERESYEALAAFRTLSETEGIIPALETAHAIAHVIKIAPSLTADQIIVVNCSGRGDKDVDTAAKHFGF